MDLISVRIRQEDCVLKDDQDDDDYHRQKTQGFLSFSFSYVVTFHLASVHIATSTR